MSIKSADKVIEQKEQDIEENSAQTNEDVHEPEKAKKRHIRITLKRDILNVTPENDIRYRGPLSYRYFKILGWLCIIIIQFGNVMMIKGRLEHTDMSGSLWNGVGEHIGSFGVPLMLIANFAILLNGHENYLKQIIINAAISVLFAFAYIYVYMHYFLEIIESQLGSKAEAVEYINQMIFNNTRWNGFFAFNIFLDMLLCALIVFY